MVRCRPEGGVMPRPRRWGWTPPPPPPDPTTCANAPLATLGPSVGDHSVAMEIRITSCSTTSAPVTTPVGARKRLFGRVGTAMGGTASACGA